MSDSVTTITSRASGDAKNEKILKNNNFVLRKGYFDYENDLTMLCTISLGTTCSVFPFSFSIVCSVVCFLFSFCSAQTFCFLEWAGDVRYSDIMVDLMF